MKTSNERCIDRKKSCQAYMIPTSSDSPVSYFIHMHSRKGFPGLCSPETEIDLLFPNVGEDIYITIGQLLKQKHLLIRHASYILAAFLIFLGGLES